MTRINSYHHQVVLSTGIVVWIVNLVVLLCLLRAYQVIIGKEAESGFEEQVLGTGFDQGCRQIFLGNFFVILKYNPLSKLRILNTLMALRSLE